jgi:hypothetical protein
VLVAELLFIQLNGLWDLLIRLNVFYPLIPIPLNIVLLVGRHISSQRIQREIEVEASRWHRLTQTKKPKEAVDHLPEHAELGPRLELSLQECFVGLFHALDCPRISNETICLQKNNELRDFFKGCDTDTKQCPGDIMSILLPKN